MVRCLVKKKYANLNLRGKYVATEMVHFLAFFLPTQFVELPAKCGEESFPNHIKMVAIDMK